MPLALNRDLPRRPAHLRAAPDLPMGPDGQVSRGLGREALGRGPLRIGDQPCLWFHAVSVGEVLLLRPLIDEMARRRPGWEIVVSTTTSTGLAVARRTYPDLVTFYAPLDFSWSTRRAVARIRPTVLALVELELWPNLIRAAKRAGAKVAIINARLSSRSYRGYRRLRVPLRSTLAPDRRRGRPERRVRRPVRRAGRPRGSRQRHRLGEVRRAGERPEQPQDPGACASCWASPRPTWSSWPAARWRARKRPRWRPTRPRAGSIPASGWSWSPAMPSGSTAWREWLERQGETVVRRSRLDGDPSGPSRPAARRR